MNSKWTKTSILILGSLSIWYIIQLPNSYEEYIPQKVSEKFQSIKNNYKIWSDSSPSESVNLEQFRKSHLKAELQASEEVWKRYVQKRKQMVGSNPSTVNPWPPQQVMYFWDYFLPTFNCPHTIERIGGLGDGGKWVCGFEFFENKKPEVNKPCVVYSFGVAYESSFEEEILRRTNCEIFGYDASVNRMGSVVKDSEPRVHFHKIYVGVEDKNGSSTLGSIMKANGHEWIDIVKMDIEGGEFNVLKQILNEFEILPFGQLQIEIHGDQEGKSFKDVYHLWEQFERNGLRAFKNEINHWPCVRAQLNPIYIEYSFINLKGEHRLIV